MYYIDKEIDLSIDFLTTEKRSFHIITAFKVDYVNRLVNFELSSYYDRRQFDKNPTNAHVSFLDLHGCPSFSLDPNLWIFRVLISNEKSPFFKAEIKNDHNIERINYNESLVE